jgi:hypothetical protein
MRPPEQAEQVTQSEFVFPTILSGLACPVQRFVISAGIAEADGSLTFPKQSLSKGVYFAEFSDVTETDIPVFQRMKDTWLCLNVT